MNIFYMSSQSNNHPKAPQQKLLVKKNNKEDLNF